MKLIIALLFLSLSQIALADDIEKQSLQLCEKIKSCALAELEGQDMPPEVKSMMLSSMDGMCAAMATEFSNESIKGDEDLRREAKACMTSLSSMSCSELMNGEADTPACKMLEKSAEKYN